MSFSARFYSFSKSYNSTAVPSGEYNEYELVSNRGLDIINPRLFLNHGLGGTTHPPTAYNYCYIPSVSRYYFVDRWLFTDGLWVAECSVDVLATYKTAIGSSTNYVLRAAAAYDGDIPDGMYPAKNYWTSQTTTVANPWSYSFLDGSYSVGIVGSGSTQYYIFNYVGFTAFLNYLLSDDYAQDAMTTLGLAVDSEAKAIIDPLQYIASVNFIPVTTTGLTVQNVKVGYVSVSATCANITSSQSRSITTALTVPVHPQASARGAYLNYPPYSRHTLDFPPFGAIDLDGAALRGATNTALSVTVTVDLVTGAGIARVNGASQVTLLKARVGVPLQIGQVIAPGYGLLSIVSDAASVAQTFASGNVLGGIASTASAIKNGLESQIPTAKSVGSVGSVADLMGTVTLYSQFAQMVDDSSATRGRPLCQRRQLSTLAGYQLIADADVPATATQQEREMIVGFLEGGYYYE